MRKKQNKETAFDYASLLATYSTANDTSLIHRVFKDLNLDRYLILHKELCKETPGYKPIDQHRDYVYVLNVFEGCCWNDLSLSEKKLAIVAALFKPFKKKVVISKVISSYHEDGKELTQHLDTDIKHLDFLNAFMLVLGRKTKPTKTDTVMRMVLWDARNMYMYGPNFDSKQFLIELFADKDLTDPSISYQMAKISNNEYTTNWARLKAHKLNWPNRVKVIFKDMAEVKAAYMSERFIF